MELRPYQREAVDAVYDFLRQRDDNPCAVLPTGCHAAGHPILMHDGRLERVEDVRIGDLVMGPDSRPRRVLALCRGEDDMYRITPHRGDSFVVNADHVLSLVCTNEGKSEYPCYRNGGEIETVTLRDYLQRSKSWRHLRKIYRVAIDFPGSPSLPIPPYILGLLLGDGGLSEGAVNLTTLDAEIEAAWEDYAQALGCSVTVKDHGDRCPTYRLRHDHGKYNLVADSLEALGLAGTNSATKFIPAMYLRASRPDRLRLLAGLIDSDGCANKSGVDYATASRELAADIVYLARSLGLWAQTTQKYAQCQTGAGGWYYRISMWGEFSEVPIRLARRIPTARRQKKSVQRTGFRVEPVGRGPFFGFTLDGDHLYVDGHFVVHHNSGKTPVIATICRDAVSLWNGRVLILAHVKELLEQALDKLRTIAPDLPVGLYSASLKRRELNYAVTIAGIQSIYQRACDLGPVDLIIVDECFVEGTLISTPAGDVPIEHIQPGMTVHNATGIGTVMATSARKVHDLVTLEYSDGTVLTCTANHPIFTESGWRKAGSLAVGSMAFGRQDLRVLRQRVSSLEQAVARRSDPSDEGAQLASPAVLFDLLFEDPGELHEVTGSPDQSLSRTQAARTQTATPGWKRRSHAPPAEAASTPRPGVDSGIGSGGAASQGSVTTQEPEDRHCQPAAPDCHRTGRSEPPIAGSSAAGYAKDALPRPKRLVRVSHHKCAGGRTVFNLHVSGHPSYFAHRVLVHNCHLIPADGEGMYRTFIGEARVVNPHVRIIGLTATPFRLKTGMICAPDNILNHVCYEVSVRDLIVQKYLCPLRTKAGVVRADMASLHVRCGEFISSEVEDVMDTDDLVQGACTEIIEQTADRRSVLIFTSGVRHGRHVADVLHQRHGVECGFVEGNTPTRERDALLERFKAGELKYLANVNVLTTGFDAPGIDCVAMLRPTLSPGLYYQMVGRGFRLHPEKSDCLVLDFGGNILRHGPVDDLLIEEPIERNGKAPMKECPGCHAIISAGYLTCPECGYEFPPPARNGHDAEASSEGILSDQVTDSVYKVTGVWYDVHHKRGDPDAPPSMRVYYRCGFATTFSEWICLEHAGFARRKAEAWWRQRSNEPVPGTIDEAVDLARCGTLAPTLSITIRRKPGSRYDEVVGHVLGPKPPRIDTDEGAAQCGSLPGGLSESEVPF